MSAVVIKQRTHALFPFPEKFPRRRCGFASSNSPPGEPSMGAHSLPPSLASWLYALQIVRCARPGCFGLFISGQAGACASRPAPSTKGSCFGLARGLYAPEFSVRVFLGLEKRAFSQAFYDNTGLRFCTSRAPARWLHRSTMAAHTGRTQGGRLEDACGGSCDPHGIERKSCMGGSASGWLGREAEASG
jgi:hypothetical protein